MVAKFLTFFGLVAAAAAVAIPIGQVAHVAPKLVYAEHEAPAHYQYTYSVHDTHTGDIKQQQEERAGDAVHGSYSLVQPDGVHRIVEYTADKIHGFNAIVRYEGTPVHSAPAKVISAAPVYAHAPVAKVAYAAPVAKVAYAQAPIAKFAYAQAPIAKVAYAAPAPVTYAHAPAQLTYAHAPAQIAYAHAPAQIAYAQAPVAKLGYAAAPIAKVAYTHNLGQVSFSSPAVSYHH